MSQLLKSGKLPKTIGGVALLVIVTLLRACKGEIQSIEHEQAPPAGTTTAPPRASEAKPKPPRPAETSRTSDAQVQSGEARIERAFEREEHEVPVEITAIVKKVLSDDEEVPRHQRFLIELSSGRTLLVAHNIDLSERVPVERGGKVEISGLYEWNSQGGVLHWTHHDPQGRHAGGFIKLAGKTYR